MTVRVVRAQALSDHELAHWREIQRSEPTLASPFFSPTFTSIIAATRDDVRVAVLEEEGRTMGFFPFQRGPLRSGRPVGSILSDYHGVIAAADASWDAKELIRACGLKTWEFHHLVATQAPFERFARSRADSMQIVLGDGFESYIRAVEQTHGRTLTRLREKTRKLERDFGQLRFEVHSDDQTALATLLRWKADQYLKTGASNILEQSWIAEVLRLAHATQTDEFSGLLSFVFAGARPVAAHLGIRCAAVCHSWFHAYDPEFSQYSPGIILLLKLTEAARDSDIELIDLGMGEYRFKRMLMSRSVALAAGAVELPSAAAAAARTRRAVNSLIRRTALAPRIRRTARRVIGRR